MVCSSCGTKAAENSKFCPSCGSTVLRSADRDDFIGKVIARKYYVEEMIGEGGMGKVFRATQRGLDKSVVLKVLRQSLLSDERTVARFQREAKAASRLNHPNSISILDFGQDEASNAMYIAMEYVQGKDLHQILSREWPLPEGRIIRVMAQVLSALSDAHNAGVIHRDLKPENIMVEQRRGEPDFVKVLDFGIAKITDAEEEGPALTRAGFVCGTPEYMSPEQARGAELDARSDLYAVGVILYQLVTGVLPFESDSAVGFATKHLTEEPLPPSRKRADVRVSAALERVIMRALMKDPNQRPPNADAFRAELLAIDRERRAASVQRKAVATGAVPARPATPPDQKETRVTDPAPWGGESTVRQDPSLPWRKPSAAAPAPDAVADLARPSAALSLHQARGRQAAMVFKAVTVTLVAMSLGLVGVYLYQLFFMPPPEPEPEVAVPPPRPVVPKQLETRRDGPLYEAIIRADPALRDLAAKKSREGDEAYARGDLSQAATGYMEAFQLDPSAELSLKLGEIYRQRDKTGEARGWWKRHLKDQPSSKAQGYIRGFYPDL